MAKKKSDYTALTTLSAKWILANLPFVFFIGLLGTTYIANRHYSEKSVRDIQSLQEEVQKLRLHYLSLKSELMFDTKHSEVKKVVEEKGISNKGKQPVKIVVELSLIHI